MPSSTPLNVIEIDDASKADLESAFGNERSHEGLLRSCPDPTELRTWWCSTRVTECRG